MQALSFIVKTKPKSHPVVLDNCISNESAQLLKLLLSILILSRLVWLHQLAHLAGHSSELAAEEQLGYSNCTAENLSSNHEKSQS